MDPRRQALKKVRHVSTGKAVGLYFRIARDGRVQTFGPCVIAVTKQGHYLNGGGPGFDFGGLEVYDAETGLLYQTERASVDGILAFGMVGPNEAPETALARLVPRELPDIGALWRHLRQRQRVEAMALEASLAGGLARTLKDAGVAPETVRFVDEDDPNESFTLPIG
jgi:hypothetical protein